MGFLKDFFLHRSKEVSQRPPDSSDSANSFENYREQSPLCSHWRGIDLQPNLYTSGAIQSTHSAHFSGAHHFQIHNPKFIETYVQNFDTGSIGLSSSLPLKRLTELEQRYRF
jgi:hypothetical protein